MVQKSCTDIRVYRRYLYLFDEADCPAASPTRLAEVMMKDYDKFWTDTHVAQLVKALKDNNVALEINAVTKVSSARRLSKRQKLWASSLRWVPTITVCVNSTVLTIRSVW